MRFDVVAFLGGLTAGAAGAALFDAVRSKRLLGQGVVTGGGFGGGSYGPGGFGGPGVFAGPPSSGGGGSMGPAVIEMAPSEEGDGLGPIVSVPPIIHDGNGVFGGSFFGVNVAPWFWPLNIFPIMQWPLMPRVPEELVCKKVEEDDEETLICRKRYPVQPVAWGPPAGWL